MALDPTIQQELIATAQALVAPGKGILAADESFPSIEKKFAPLNIPATEETRQAYRDMLLTTAGAAQYISGVILFDETIRQQALSGQLFPAVLQQEGIIPGIKVDQGLESITDSPEEKVTKGLEGLHERLVEYKALGARFAKWRAVVTIGQGIPTDACLQENARRLAEYAAACQEVGIVPIVEPEVLMDGGHDVARCEDVTRRTLTALFAALKARGVFLPGLLLKPNMVIAGKTSATQASSVEIAEATIRVFTETVPAEVPGIVFLSGGQSDVQATANLNAINQKNTGPWQLTFSYGRALQDAPLKTWAGKPENVPVAQQAFLHRAKMNSLARAGQYNESME